MSTFALSVAGFVLSIIANVWSFGLTFVRLHLSPTHDRGRKRQAGQRISDPGGGLELRPTGHPEVIHAAIPCIASG